MPVDVLTSGTSYTKIGTITNVQGWGGGGGTGSGGNRGGGGAWTQIANPAGVPSTVTIIIGSDSTDTDWNSSQLVAKSGSQTSAGLAASCVPSTGAHSGGAAGAGSFGGSGSGGPDGAGNTTASATGGSGDAGSGGAGGTIADPGTDNVKGGGGGGESASGGNPGGGQGFGSGSGGGGTGQLQITYTTSVASLYPSPYIQLAPLIAM